MKKMKWKDPNAALPGVSAKSTLYHIYCALNGGAILTALDGINQFKTMHLGKYISILMLDYDIPVHNRWIELASGKWCKEYFL